MKQILEERTPCNSLKANIIIENNVTLTLAKFKEYLNERDNYIFKVVKKYKTMSSYQKDIVCRKK